MRDRTFPPFTVAYRGHFAQDREVEPLWPLKSWPEAVLNSEVSMKPPDRRNQLPTFIGDNRKTFQETKSIIESLLHWPGTQTARYLPANPRVQIPQIQNVCVRTTP